MTDQPRRETRLCLLCGCETDKLYGGEGNYIARCWDCWDDSEHAIEALYSTLAAERDHSARLREVGNSVIQAALDYVAAGFYSQRRETGTKLAEAIGEWNAVVNFKPEQHSDQPQEQGGGDG
jgi:hypothetical protein